MTDRTPGPPLPADTVFVLGAQDPEMREIQRVLDDARRPWVHAAVQGRRCNARTAYDGDGVVRLGPDGIARAAVLPPRAPAVFVECSVRGHPAWVQVDHHHPGDAGFEVPPERFLDGASLGQVLRLLGREPTPTQRLLAAGDHCLTAAYQGRCPGVDPDELLFLRASWQAKVSGRTLTEVVQGILDAAARVRRQFDAVTGEAAFLDPTRVPRDLPEGAALAGLPVRYRGWREDGDLKEMLKGGTPAHIQRFMDGHRAAGRSVYGNPYRGYAGAYWVTDGPDEEPWEEAPQPTAIGLVDTEDPAADA
jgi:hypothetical protein